MKPTRANFVLAAVCVVLFVANAWQLHVRLRADKSPPTPAHASSSGPATPVTGSAAIPVVEVPAPAARTNSRPTAEPVASNIETNARTVFDWRTVESEDYRAYVDNLRRIGVPEQTVRDIVSADVTQSLAGDRRELLRRFVPTNYWQTTPEDAVIDLTDSKRALDERTGSILRDLLGEDYLPPTLGAEWRQAETELKLDFLDPGRRSRVAEVLALYDELDRQIRQTTTGRPPTQDEAQLKQMLDSYAQRRQALDQLLSPAEYEELDMRASWTADNLRRAMIHFEPTEEEFRAIFKIWRAQDENLAVVFATGQPDPGKDHVLSAIHDLLGDERFKRYQETWWK